ncbi:hypothetical protein AB5I83_17815 [Mesobacillus sp. LC4]
MFRDPLFKTFFILRLNPETSLISNLLEQFISNNKHKIKFSSNEIANDVIATEIVWETTNEIESQELHESGIIEVSPQMIKTVNTCYIWYKKNSPFIYVFSKKATLVLEVMEMLERYFGIMVERVNFSTQTFNKLLYFSNNSQVLQVSFRSNNENLQTFTISGSDILNSETFRSNYKEDNEITQLTILFSNYDDFKAKIYKNARVALSKIPYEEDLILLINTFNNLLLDETEGLY